MGYFRLFPCLVIGVFLWMNPGVLYGQVRPVDTLDRLLQNHPQRDSFRCALLFELAQAHISGANPRLFLCAEEMLSIAGEIRSDLFRVRGHNLLAVAYTRSGNNLNRAIEHFDTAFHIMAHQKGREWREREAKMSINFGGILMLSGNYRRAEQYINRAANLFQGLQDTSLVAVCYQALGQVHWEMHQVDSALLYTDRAVALFAVTGNMDGLAKTEVDRCRYFLEINDLESARNALQVSMSNCDSTQAPSLYENILHAAGKIYTRMHRWGEAEQFLRRALALSGELNVTREIEDVHRSFAELFEQSGQLDSAMVHFRRYQGLQEERLMAERKTQLQEIEARYMVREQARENDNLRNEKILLQREKQLALALYLAVLLLLLVAGRFLWLRYQRRIQQKTEELQEFNYSVGHDLRAPLQNAQQWLAHLRTDIRLNRQAEWEGDLNELDRSLARLREMLDGMVRWFSLEEAQPMFSMVDPSQLATAVWQDLLRVQDKHTVVPVLIIDQWPAVPADKLMLRQVLENLLSNAMKFSRTAEDPKVSLELADEGTVWHFRIHDNGIGFSPEQAGQLFRLFKSLHSRDRFPGTGIGLALVKRLVEKMGGTVNAESAGPSRGATFSFTLPKRNL